MEAIQIAIGGVPNGNKTYGDSKAIGYVEQLYNREVGNSPYKYYFKIEAREEEGKECFYYSYIVPQITDQIGRSGGYFTIVLRSCNHYCEDLSRLYQLLKQTYDKKVEGVLLGKDKKFIVSNFDKANSESIIQFLRRNIDNCFSQSFTLLDRKLNKNGKCVKRHISEQGCDLFLNTLFECGEAILAPEIHRSENKLQPLEAKIKKLNDIIMAKNKSIQDLENKKGELEEQNAELKSENGKLQREVEKSRNADDALRQIREIFDNTLGAKSNAYVAKSRDYNKERENPVDASWGKKKKKILIWSIVILAVFLLGFGIGIVSTHKKTDEQTEQSKEQTTQAIRSIRLNRDTSEKEHDREIHSGDTILFVADATSVMDWGVDGFEEISSCYVVTKADIDTATISFTDYLGEKSKHRFPVK
ncbi:MAG: hypothetical protein MSS87_00125 [Bacteroidales bacterium]|nr:hypothetical protein [Bacteroidales bacterium]MDY5737611.1 hypothetical protein [Candidatus Onthomorpha sp.]